ncbi:DUF6959 family protein [Nocardia neocaledoniensis]|uniref:DUF6959 family protein n=1 Tax=Nocardia neocaledoniensis TaxID=236511 RepID=UPI002453DC33|nr:hypothetical protein [Nocardia neocaledoniensis]
MNHSAELLGTQGDYSLIKWEGRRFPGLLIRGDTLSILVSDLREVRDLLNARDVDEALLATDDLLNRMTIIQKAYEVMMSSAGVKLPYAADG